MNNKPVAWINEEMQVMFRQDLADAYPTLWKPLYTHPVKEEHFEDEPQAEELHEILQSNAHPADLTDEEIEEFAYAFELWQLHNPDKALEGIKDFARAILKKAKE